MKTFGLTILATAFSAMASEPAPQLSVQHPGNPVTGSADNFAGRVLIDSWFEAQAPGRTGGAMVHFDPGARTVWHTHPLGQSLIIASGCGWVQSEGGEVQTVRPGDVVWIPANVRHWHGASASTPMSHFAVAESLDGSVVTWMEQVSDEQYLGGEPAGPDCESNASREEQP